MPTNKPGYNRAWRKKTREKLIAALGEKCENPACGCVADLEIHHVKRLPDSPDGRGRGSNHRYADYRACLRKQLETGEKYLSLYCEECHKAVDKTQRALETPEEGKEGF